MARGNKRTANVNLEEKVTIRIPQDPLNPELKVIRVIINGYFYDIEIGKEVLVPVGVKDVLIQGKRI